MLALAAMCLFVPSLRAQAIDPPARFDRHTVVRIHPRTLRDMRTALALTDDVWTCGFSGEADSPTLTPAPIDIRLTPDAHAALVASGVPFTLLIQDVQKLIDAERPPPPLLSPRGPGTFFAAYQDYASVSAYVSTLAALRPDMATRLTVGASLQPREIFALRVSSPNSLPGSKPAVVLYGCQHAREWITVMSSMYIADQLVRNYDTDVNIRRLLDAYEFYIIPIANPDGYVHTWTSYRLWRKNRRPNADGSFGVDLNRNWGYQWGGFGSSGQPTSDTYRGAAAFSEPCTQALRDFIWARPNTVLSFDLHSYSQVILEPWGYTFGLPPDTCTFSQITTAMQTAMSASSGGYFYGGETYRALYPVSGGSHDWALAARGILAYGVELRDRGNSGFVLPPAEIIPGAREAQAGVFAAAGWLLEHSATVTFTSGQPLWLAENSSTTIQTRFSRGLAPLGDPSFAPPTVYTRVGRNAPFISHLLPVIGIDEAGAVFSHTLSSGPCSSVTQWYYTLPLPDGSTAIVPRGGESAPFEAPSRAVASILADDFESDRGWTVGDTTPGSADTATVGVWTRTDPNGTTAQTEYDHTPMTGAACFITGQNPRGNVDSGRVGIGKTTLTSPIFGADASSRVDASMWLWTMTSQTQTFVVDVTNNAGSPTPTWSRVLTINSTSPDLLTTPRWNRHTFRLSSIVAPSASMRLRFIASSTGPNDIVEIALDDITIDAITCERAPCPGDYNADGMVTVQDVFDFLNDWFAGSPRAALTGNPLSVQDIFDFINFWFAPC